MDEETNDVKLVRKHTEELGEYFDSVQIFCTRHESGEKHGTVRLSLGNGNWFARYGQVIEWVKREEEQSRITARLDSNLET